jgi:hypothetical protein
MNARRLFSNVSLVVILSTGFVGASLAFSYLTGKWHWFGRLGALATMAGVLLSVRPLVRMGFAEWIAYTSTIDGATLSQRQKKSRYRARPTLMRKLLKSAHF